MSTTDSSDPDMKDIHRLDLSTDDDGKMTNGPVMNRKCTDCICCLLFVIFIIGLGFTSAYGFMYGDPLLLLTTWDYDANGCGYNESTLDYPYLYFPGPDISNISDDPLSAFKYSVCVKECPSGNENKTVLCKEPSFFDASAKFENCTYYPAAYEVYDGYTYYGDPFRYGTTLVIGKYCIPDTDALKDAAVSTFYDYFEEYFDVQKLTEYASDIYEAWMVLLISVGIAFLLGFVYLLLLRCCAGVMVFFSLTAILAALGGGGVWLFFIKDDYAETSKSYNFCLYAAYVLWGVAGLYFLILLCLCSRIRLGIAILKCTAQFIGSTP
mmetsp:Transcript_27452/g.20609  ORF Transcript_27452/g.20609 Transcript_27452/m.20609 type:complete len:324 (-) Transcript_27452:420-1391(-)